MQNEYKLDEFGCVIALNAKNYDPDFYDQDHCKSRIDDGTNHINNLKPMQYEINRYLKKDKKMNYETFERLRQKMYEIVTKKPNPNKDIYIDKKTRDSKNFKEKLNNVMNKKVEENEEKLQSREKPVNAAIKSKLEKELRDLKKIQNYFQS
jgi:flagellar biosynthesis GTPase FlhF